MPLIEEFEWTAGSTEQLLDAGMPVAGGFMDSRIHCAYNQTRECFLGLEVSAADLSYLHLQERLETLMLKSGEGLWLTPFRGIPTVGITVPLDLIYLDESCRVIETVESFPTFLASPSSPRAASVLVLPAHSIYSSQTQPGDQLALCVAEEMERRLERLSSPACNPAVMQGAVLLRESPLWSGGPGLVEMENRSGVEPQASQQTHEMSLIEPGVKVARPPKNWLERWWSPDPRIAPRIPAHGLAAYYWNGAAPEAHSIRDISTTGLYVITEERWYPGTLLLMTLQRTDCGEQAKERAISVQSRAVRWGKDGVGLQFVLPNARESRLGSKTFVDVAGRKEIERFLKLLKKGR
jgi:hypothetical protein